MKLSLVDWVPDTDLRKVVRRSENLERLVRSHELRQEGDTVVFVNAAMDRFRFVVLAGGVPMMLLPPSAGKHDLLLSIFLRVSLYLQAVGKGRHAPRRVREGRKTVMEKAAARERRRRRRRRGSQ